MKALVLKGLREAQVEDVPVPGIGRGEVLIRVDSCAICGTDLRTYRSGHSRINGPRVTGHEFSGTVAQVGEQAAGYREGDRVIVVPGIPCRHCSFCRQGLENLCDHRVIIGFDFDGGFAEYVKVPEPAVSMGNIKAVPDGLTLREACLVEPFTAVSNGQALLELPLGASVGIVGAGPIGIMHALLARFRGARQIAVFDISAERCRKAGEFPVDAVIQSGLEDPVQAALELTRGRGFDAVVVACVSGVAQAQALKMVRKAGRVSFFAGLPHDASGVELDTNLIHYKQLGVFGANGSGPNQFEATLGFLGSRQLDLSALITAEFALDDAVAGFAAAQSAAGLKTIIRPRR